MKTTWTVSILAAVVLGGMARADEAAADEVAQVAVLKRDIWVADRGTGELPYPRSGEVLPSPVTTDAGCYVVCRDSDGAARMALLPGRDEWGHPTARDWKHDESLAQNTVRIQRPQALKPGAFLLSRGAKYKVVAVQKNRYTVAYEFADYAATAQVSARDADLEPLVEEQTDPGLRRIAALEKTLAERRAEQERIAGRLGLVRSNNALIVGLLRQVGEAEIEAGALAAELVQAQKLYARLTGPTPETRDIWREQRTALGKLMAEREQLAAEVALADLSSDVLAVLHEQMLGSAAEVARLRTDSTRAQADLKALVDHWRDGTLQKEQARIDEALENATEDLASHSAQVEYERLRKDFLTRFAGQLEDVLEENARLRAELAAIAAELDALRARFKADEPEAPARSTRGKEW